jgi:hypothetical protein
VRDLDVSLGDLVARCARAGVQEQPHPRSSSTVTSMKWLPDPSVPSWSRQLRANCS